MHLYHFFDYKYDIQAEIGPVHDMFSTPHLIYIVLAILSVIAIGIFLRKVDHKKIDKFLKIASLVILAMEIFKISWETHFDMMEKWGGHFNIGGIMPLYTCSLLIYCSLLGAWTKGIVREISLSCLSTIGLTAGIVGVIYTNGLNYYPFFSFGAFYSLIFHYALFALGIFLITTGYVKLEWKHIYLAWIPIVCLSAIASPFNYAYGADYMSIYEAGSVPLFESLGEKFAAINLRPVFTIIMILSYLIITSLIISIVKLVKFLINKFGSGTQTVEA